MDRCRVRPHLRYVAALVALGRRSEARIEYSERVASGQATEPEHVMAQRLQTNGASSALRRVYTAAAERMPNTPWWRLALAEVETAEADAWNTKRIDAIDRGDRPAERQAFEQSHGAIRRAHRAVEQAAAISPRLPEVSLYRGYLRAVEGDLHPGAQARTAAYMAGEAAFFEATRRDPALVEAWGGLGDVRFRSGDLKGSLEAYVQAVRLAPADAQMRTAMGVVLHEVGRLKEASEQYREASRLRPWDAKPMLRLGDALADAREWDGALTAYRDALRRDGEAVEAHYKMGTVLEYLRRNGEARAAFERYVAQEGPRSAAVRRRIERLLRTEGR